jgi:hypothetical protein
MITPSYAATATERVLPRMALDFTTGVLDPRVTVTRLLNTATRVNSSGLIETVNANLPRFDYDPVTLAPKGLLIEESRTNVIPASSDFNNGFWLKLGVSVTSDVIVAPDGTLTGDRVVGATGTAFSANVLRFNSGLTAGGASNVASAYVIADGATTMQMYFRDGVNGNVYSTPVISLTAGWQRITLSIPSANIGILFFGNSNGNFGLWGAQLEAGAFATSYIPTTTLAVLRNADAVTMTGTNFSDWYNASQSTLMAEASTFSNAATDKFVANINNNGFPNRILMNFTATNNFSASLVSNSVTQVSGSNGVSAALNTPIKMCFATKLDSFAFSQSGVSPTTDNLGVMPVTVDRLWIGSAFTTAFLNGHMRQIKYWPQRLIDAETQAFSK